MKNGFGSGLELKTTDNSVVLPNLQEPLKDSLIHDMSYKVDWAAGEGTFIASTMRYIELDLVKLLVPFLIECRETGKRTN